MNKKGVYIDKETLAKALLWLIVLAILIGLIIQNKEKIINLLEDIFSYRGP